MGIQNLFMPNSFPRQYLFMAQMFTKQKQCCLYSTLHVVSEKNSTRLESAQAIT